MDYLIAFKWLECLLYHSSGLWFSHPLTNGTDTTIFLFSSWSLISLMGVFRLGPAFMITLISNFFMTRKIINYNRRWVKQKTTAKIHKLKMSIVTLFIEEALKLDEIIRNIFFYQEAPFSRFKTNKFSYNKREFYIIIFFSKGLKC